MSSLPADRNSEPTSNRSTFEIRFHLLPPSGIPASSPIKTHHLMSLLHRVSRLLPTLPLNPRTMSTKAQTLFFKSAQFAVAGASKDQTKYGTKVLKWYQAREMKVTPVHPKEPELEGVKAVTNLTGLESPSRTSVSIVTPPKVTLALLKEGKELGVPAFWLQPGAEDEEVLKYVTKEGLTDRVVFGGPCVLVSGDDILKSLL
ncbi:unnamed protein product [Rhizoctonia solani]|uniref:CoA-binding domain-containing protein n=1 Tax=Rhizoctonia solani TaxID=456999 RepID=A0A8H3DJW2_9AGAM|nr:unnamed protein product [Rhizoctonia solani]